MLNIVLLEPEIPANTGNIGRTCVATGSRLHLIEPLGFQINEKQLRRAGMDYWKDLDVTTYIDFEDFMEKNPDAKIFTPPSSTAKPSHLTPVTAISYSSEPGRSNSCTRVPANRKHTRAAITLVTAINFLE